MKTNTLSLTNQKYLARLKDFTLMDDDFMNAVFQNDTEVTATVLQIIMEKPGLRVLEVKTQEKLKNLRGRTAVLDIKATDSEGTLYDIEIQRSDKGSGFRRARYYSSLLDGISLKSGEDTDKLPEVYVIFITENDVIGEGFPVYHIKRTIEGSLKPFDDGSHILFVNGQFRGNHPIGDLMHDFHCTNPDDMKNRVIAEKTRVFKENGGTRNMHGRIYEEIEAAMRNDPEVIAEIKSDPKVIAGIKSDPEVIAKIKSDPEFVAEIKNDPEVLGEIRRDTVVGLLNEKLSLETIAKVTKMSIDEIREIEAIQKGLK